MNQEITPEQQAQLNSWAGQRDSILKGIADARVEEEKLITSNKDLSQSNTEIANKIQQGIGRLEQIAKQEAERKNLVSSELVTLESKKTALETTITSLEGDVKNLSEKKSELLRDVANITGFHDHVFEKAHGLVGIISENVSVSQETGRQIVSTLEAAEVELKKVIEIGEKNVEKTNKLVLDIPKIIVDLHQDVIERRKIAKNRKI